MSFGVGQLSLAFSKLLSICEVKKENVPATTTATTPNRPRAAEPAPRTTTVPKTVVKSSSPSSPSSPARNMAEGDSGSGIIVFTLWYIAIAVGYAMENFFKPKERYESETNTEVLSVDQIIPKSQDAVRAPSFFTADPPLFTPLKTTVSETAIDPEPPLEELSEPQNPNVMAVSEDSFVEASPSPLEEHEPMAEIIAEYVAETQGGDEPINNFESNQEFLHEEIPDAQTEEVTEHVFDIDD